MRPKEFAVLLALVENHGHVLTKDELLKGVWPGQFVEEGNLNRHISTLRRVLGETPGEPQYVETVPKIGYRFVAEVREIRDQSADMVIERHTIARIVTEEEEVADDGRVELGPAVEPKALPASGEKGVNRRRRLERISGGARING
jgi:DNA-binding winged helix-turn-helix (wHTH) protein